MSALLEVRGLTRSFLWRQPLLRWPGRGRSTASRGGSRRLLAVDRVDLDLRRGECLALVGESGSGKTTLGRCMIRLLEPDAGKIRFDGEDLRSLGPGELRRRRVAFQMVFQDSASALNPRLRIAAAVAEPLMIHRIVARHEISSRVRALLETVGLGEGVAGRYPHQLSGGQRQRVGIARALATAPRLLILDEPVAALDVSVQAQILRLLAELQERLGLAMIFIAHDLAVVEQIAERVAVLYLGRLVEVGPRREIFRRPLHPYTVSLLDSVPVPDPARRRRHPPLRGEIPSPLSPPAGCPFHPRCAITRPRCREEAPRLTHHGDGHAAACHYPGELPVAGHRER